MAQRESSLPVVASANQIPRVPWGIADIAKALGLLIVATLFIIVPAVTVASFVADDSASITDDPEALAIIMGANLLLEVLLVVAALLFSVRKYRCSLRDLGFRMPRKGGLWLPAFLLVAAYLTIGVYFSVITAIGEDRLLPDEGSIPEAVFDSPVTLPIAALLALLFAPLMEETFFRGFVFGTLRWRWGLFSAALVSGFLFSALHFSLATLLPFTVIGMIFAWAYAYSGSLFASMAAHFAFNVISFLVSLAQR